MSRSRLACLLAGVGALVIASFAVPSTSVSASSPVQGLGGIGARCCMGMTYDGTNNQIVLFGGCCDSLGNYWADTWTWDGSTWHNVTPLVKAPARV